MSVSRGMVGAVLLSASALVAGRELVAEQVGGRFLAPVLRLHAGAGDPSAAAPMRQARQRKSDTAQPIAPQLTTSMLARTTPRVRSE